MAEIEQWHEDLLQRLRRRRGGPTGRARYSPRRPRRRDRTAVITDSSAALPRVVLEHPLAAGLRQVPMPVMIGDQIHSEGTAELDRDLPLALAAGTTVRTSRPAPGVFSGVYQEVAEAGFARIISIHLSGKLSGTADAARIAELLPAVRSHLSALHRAVCERYFISATQAPPSASVGQTQAQSA